MIIYNLPYNPIPAASQSIPTASQSIPTASQSNSVALVFAKNEHGEWRWYYKKRAHDDTC